MRKLLIIFIFTFVSFGLYHLSKNILGPNKDLTTYKKLNDQIISYPTTKEEMQTINKNNINNRKPASTSMTLIDDKEVNKKWQLALSNELLRFQDADTKIILENLERITLNDKSGKTIAQKVIITYLYPNNRNYSAKALVDLKTSKIIKAWNRTKHEDFFLRENKLTPTNL